MADMTSNQDGSGDVPAWHADVLARMRALGWDNPRLELLASARAVGQEAAREVESGTSAPTHTALLLDLARTMAADEPPYLDGRGVELLELLDAYGYGDSPDALAGGLLVATYLTDLLRALLALDGPVASEALDTCRSIAAALGRLIELGNDLDGGQ